MRKISIIFIVMMLMCVCLFSACEGCNKSQPTGGIETDVESVHILHYTKERFKFTLVGISEEDEKNLLIKSKNEKIAVYDNGYIFGMGVGETEIEFSCGDASKSIKVTVVSNSNLPTLQFNKEEVAIYNGGDLRVQAYVSFQGRKVDFSDFEYSVENPNVATVDADGNVKGLSIGTTYLTATCNYFNTELINSIPVKVNPLVSVDWKEIVSEITLCTSTITGEKTQIYMPAQIIENGTSNNQAKYTVVEVDEGGNPVNSGFIRISDANIYSVKEGTAFVMAIYEANDGTVYNSRIIKIDVKKPLLKYDGVIEIDLNGEKTTDISQFSSILSLSERIIGVQVAGENPVDLVVNGNVLEGLTGSENCTLIFKTASIDMEVSAKIYTLKIGDFETLTKLGEALETNKVEIKDENGEITGYTSGGYYVLTNDIITTNKHQISPSFYIKNTTNSNNGFTGVFDGQGYTIKDINTLSQRNGSKEKAGSYAWGLFSSIANGGVVKNVSILAGATTATNTIFGKYCHGTLENVRVHIEKGSYGGERAPLFDYSIKNGTIIKNVFVTFGAEVTFSGSNNGLISTFCDSNGVTIEGLYVVGGYSDTHKTSKIRTWCKQESSNNSYIKAMTKDGVKYGAYFVRQDRFEANVEQIDGVNQHIKPYNEQIAQLFDANVWDLSGIYPQLKGGASVEVEAKISVDWEESSSEITLYTSSDHGGKTQMEMPVVVKKNKVSVSTAKCTIQEVDENGKTANSGCISISGTNVISVKEGVTYIMATYQDETGAAYNSRIVKVSVKKPLVKYNGSIEIDLNGEKTFDVSQIISMLSIGEKVTGIQIAGEKPIDCVVTGNVVEGLVGRESCSLIFKTASFDMEVSAKIYTLKIGDFATLTKLGTVLEQNKVAVTDGAGAILGYTSDGYYVLTNDVITTNKHQVTPSFYIKDTSANNGFIGVFDGQGYTIKDINVLSQRNGSGDKKGTYAWGMFSTLAEGGVIKNVSIIAGETTATNALFGKYCLGTLENIRIHVEKGSYGGEKAPLFDRNINKGATIKNVFVTFGLDVTFSGINNGLIASLCETSVDIEGLYVVGGYADTHKSSKIKTWCKQESSNKNYVNAMTKDGVKYGAYFASKADFINGIETINGEAQAATDIYKNQIANLYDSSVWDLTGDYPELKKR